MTLQVKQNLLQGTPKTDTQLYNGKRVIVIHNTATPNATAENENLYFQRNWSNIQSFVHAFVDWSGDAVEHQTVGKVAWGAGSVNKYAWLQVEQCIGTAEQNRHSAEYTAQYVALKIKESGLTFDDYVIFSHADVSKLFGGTDHTDTIEGVGWTDFINRIKELTTEQVTQTTETATTVTTVGEPTSGVFRCDYAIKARSFGPDTNNKHIYTFKPGDKIKYDRQLVSGNHVWISQPRSDGSYWYIPIREKTGILWGSMVKG